MLGGASYHRAIGEIVTERLVLRPFETADLAGLVAYRSDPDVAAYQSWDPDYSTRDAERFLAQQLGLALGQPGEWVQLAIADREAGTLYGDCAARVDAVQAETAEIGITLARASQGNGIAAEALRALVTALFRDHGVHRVFAHADDRNEPVHRLLVRLGLRLEGRLVEADWFKGEWTTLRIYAVLAREWGARDPAA
jgi:RimJ/RimL family protein N-acetyltransferase